MSAPSERLPTESQLTDEPSWGSPRGVSMRTFYNEYFLALPGALWSTTCKAEAVRGHLRDVTSDLVGADAGRCHLRHVASALVGAEAGRHHQLVDLPPPLEAVGAGVRLGEAVGYRAC